MEAIKNFGWFIGAILVTVFGAHVTMAMTLYFGVRWLWRLVSGNSRRGS